MHELINTLSQKTGLSEDKSRIAVDTVVNYLKSKLPESVSGQVANALTDEGGSSTISEKIGGMLGKKSA